MTGLRVFRRPGRALGRGASARKPNRHGRLLATALAAALVLTGCVTASPSPTVPTAPSSGAPPTPGTTGRAGTGRFEPGACAFKKPDGMEVACGYLVVPEDRAVTSGREIRLHVATFKSTSPRPKPDPVVFLQGGPGASALDLAQQILDRTPFLAERDVILFDQRGTGFSRPSLDCTEAETLFFRTLNEVHTRAELNALDDASSATCRDRVTRDGTQPSAYDSGTNAEDLADLRIALGHASWNLFGSSYGTRLALETMRSYPEGIRSVILDAVYPPQVDSQAGLARNADRALSLVFSQCADDAACNRAYPGLDQAFSEAVARLNREPGRLAMSDWTNKRNYPAVVNGDGFISVLFDMLYDTDTVPVIPRAIYEARDGQYDAVSQDLSYTLETMRYLSEAMYQAVECAEEAPFTTPDAVRAGAVGVRPEIADYFAYEAQSFLDQCRTVWKVAPEPARANEPVRSAIPTLMLVGEFDPITPPSMAEAAREFLSASSLHVFPGVGHGVMGSRYCADTIVLDFLADPRPNPATTCLNALPKVAFVPPRGDRMPQPPTIYSDVRNGMSISLPADWLLLSPELAGDRTRLDEVLATYPEYGQFIRDSVRQLAGGMILAGHDRRAGNDILATATPTLLVYRAPGAMAGRSLEQIARDQVGFLRQQGDVSRQPTVATVQFGGREMQEIHTEYRSWHLGREITVTLVNYLAQAGNDLYFVQFARPSDASRNGVVLFRDLASTIRLGG
jgi:pimeloyl-ACP methyl ester carboxylesterase